MKDLKLVMTGLPKDCNYRLVYKDPVTGAETNHDFYSVETLYLQDGKYEFKDGNLNKVADLATLKVDVDLKDIDGSERFTDLTITGLPTGAVVQGGSCRPTAAGRCRPACWIKTGKCRCRWSCLSVARISRSQWWLVRKSMIWMICR